MRKIPFLRICLALIIGIITNSYFLGFIEYKFILSLVLIGGTIYSFFQSSINHRHVQFFGNLLLLSIFSIGLFIAENNRLENHKNHFIHEVKNHYSKFTGNICSIKETNKGTQFIIEVQSCGFDSTLVLKEGKLQVFTPVKGDYQIGQIVHFSSKVSSFMNNNNAYAFDYARFMANQNVFHQCYTKDFKVIETPNSPLRSLKSTFKSTINNLEVSENTKQLVLAMLLGDKSGMKHQTEIFRSTGTSHVLAISGLHVGIIATILNFLFMGIPDRFRHFKNGIIIMGVWMFCMLSGMSASTVRASIMVSSYLIGLSFRLKGYGFNFCFLSGFFMLLFDPNQIYNVGFQFSYLAIIGILFFYEPMYKVLVFKGFKNTLWQMAVLSLSAQTALLPLSLFYFHEFPLLFIPASIIAIPATFIIIAWSLVSLVLSLIIDSQLPAQLLEWFVQFFVDLLSIFSNIEGAVISNLYPGKTEVLIYYAILIAVSSYFLNKEFKYLKLATIGFVCLMVFQLYTISSISSTKLVIYGDSQNILIDIINSGSCYSLTEKGTRSYSSTNAREGMHAKHAINRITNHEIPQDKNQLLKIGDIKLFVLNNTQELVQSTYDYVLINTEIESVDILPVSKHYIDFANNQSYSLSPFINNQQIIHNIN